MTDRNNYFTISLNLLFCTTFTMKSVLKNPLKMKNILNYQQNAENTLRIYIYFFICIKIYFPLVLSIYIVLSIYFPH